MSIMAMGRPRGPKRCTSPSPTALRLLSWQAGGQAPRQAKHQSNVTEQVADAGGDGSGNLRHRHSGDDAENDGGDENGDGRVQPRAQYSSISRAIVPAVQISR